MDTRILRVQHQRGAALVAVYPGLPAEELADLLQAVFQLSAQPLGLATEDGTILPLSLVCRSPQHLVSPAYTLLTRTPYVEASAPEAPAYEAPYEAPPKYEQLQPQYEAEAAFPNASAPQAEIPDFSQERPLEYGESNDAEDDTALASINPQNFSKLLKFFAVMRSKKMINKEEARALEELVFDDNVLLHAAFSVAESAKDADYLAEICRDIGQSVQTEEGRTALGAQEDLLYICDNLHQAGQLTDNQLLYLRHLVLVRDEVVAAIYEDFTNDNNENKLARSLVLLANTHPAEFHTPEPQEQPVPFEADFHVEKRIPQLGTRDHQQQKQQKQQQQQQQQQQQAARPAASNDARTRKQQQKQQGASESAPVNVRKMLAVLNAATQLLLRAKKISPPEIELLQDLVADEDEYVIAACDVYLQDQNMDELQDTLLRRVRFEARKRRDSEDFQQQSARTASSATSRQTEPPAQQQSAADADQAVVDQVVADQIRRVMLALGVEDGWGDNVPLLFKRIVFVAAEAKLLSVEQAAVLCHLYAAEYDLVHAAWEVYQVASDDRDFIDTLFRIVRDLDVQPTEKETRDREKATQAAKEKLKRTRAAAIKASEEITKAKLELLNQTLALMTKQKFINAEQGAALFAKAQEGDAMIDAAIEAYAHDRDVSRFVDTLQILANNTDQLDGASTGSDRRFNAVDNVAQEEQGTSTDDGAGTTTGDERAQQELRDLVNLLFDDGKISNPERAVLSKLIAARDDRVLAAHDVYLEFQDVDDLVDSLLRVAKREVSNASGASEEDQGIEMRKLGKLASTESAATDDYTGVLTPEDIEQILAILGQSNAIGESDLEVLTNLARSNDQTISAVFDAYEQNKDVYKLIQSLQTLAVAARGSGQQDRNDDDRSAEEALNKFLDIVEDMQLSEIETAALRLAIARDDDDIRAALEVFRLENDADDLMDTLRRIAQRVMRELGKSPNSDIFPRARNQQDGASEDAQGNAQEVSDEDQLDDETEEGADDEADADDEDDADGNGMLTTQGARQHIFPILVSELVKNNFLTSRQMLVLLALLEQDDATIHAALDVYDNDNNLVELVDTLQRISNAVIEVLGQTDDNDDDGDDDVRDDDENDEAEEGGDDEEADEEADDNDNENEGDDDESQAKQGLVAELD